MKEEQDMYACFILQKEDMSGFVPVSLCPGMNVCQIGNDENEFSKGKKGTH